MKKFTRLWQLMMILLLSSSVAFAQVEQSTQAERQQTSKEVLDLEKNVIQQAQKMGIKTEGQEIEYEYIQEIVQSKMMEDLKLEEKKDVSLTLEEQEMALQTASQDRDPDAKYSQTTSDYLFDFQFEWQVLNPGGIPYTIPGAATGVETDGNYIYFTYWQSDTLYRHDMSGNYVGYFVIPGVSALRDLAYDGTYFYGAAATTSVFQMDFTPGAEALVSTIVAPTAIRAIGYDDDNSYLFGNNWTTDVNIFDMTGTFVSSFTCGPIGASYYGFAYDNYTTGSHYIWGYAQTGNMNLLVQINYPSGIETGNTFDVSTVSSYWTSTADIAGGLAIAPVGTFVPGEWTIFGAIQNISCWGLELGDPNPCSTPSNLTANAVTETTADLGWTEAGTSTVWDIELGLAGFVPTGTPTHPGVTTNPYTVTGLLGTTSYDFYVRADCGGGMYSGWAGPYNFITACATVVVTDASPLAESFPVQADPVCWVNTSSNPVANCLWEYGNATLNPPGYDMTGTADHTGTGGFYAWADGSTPVVADITLLTPPLDVTGVTTPYIEFYMKSYNDTYASSGYCTFYCDFWDGAAWNNLLTYSGSYPDWQLFGFNVSGYMITGDVQFRFIVDQLTATTAFYNDIALDDIWVGNAPSCPAPTGLTVTAVTTATASLEWVAGGTETMWNIEYGPAGFTQGTGTLLTGVTDENPLVPDIQYTLTGLSPATAYDVYVQADCGTDDVSFWVGPVGFTTPCIPFVAPWSEDFTTWPPLCWDLTGGTYSWIQYAIAPTYCAEASFWGQSAGNTDLMTIGVNTSLLTAPALWFDWSHLYSASYPTDQMDVNVSDDGGATWNTVWSLIGAAFDSGDGATSTAPGSFVTSGFLDLSGFGPDVLIQFYGLSGYGPDVFVDNVVVDEMPACAFPTALGATNITGTSADLFWTDNAGASFFDIELWPCWICPNRSSNICNCCQSLWRNWINCTNRLRFLCKS